jgi:hypothetical protein
VHALLNCSHRNKKSATLPAAGVVSVAVLCSIQCLHSHPLTQVQQSTLATHAQPSQSTPLFKRPHAIVPIYQAARSHCANGKVSLFRQQCLIVQAAMSHHSSSKISLFRQNRYSSGNTPNATLIVSQACDASCNKACH